MNTTYIPLLLLCLFAMITASSTSDASLSEAPLMLPKISVWHQPDDLDGLSEGVFSETSPSQKPDDQEGLSRQAVEANPVALVEAKDQTSLSPHKSQDNACAATTTTVSSELSTNPGGKDDPVAEQEPLILDADGKAAFDELAVATAFAREMKVAYYPENRQFYRFNSEEGLWELLDRHQAMVLIVSYLKALATKCDVAGLKRKAKPATGRSILELVKGHAMLPSPRSTELLPVANGVLDLAGERPELRSYQAEDGFTGKIPVNFVPSATCPRFLNELVQPALSDADDVALLQRDFGRQLVPGNHAQTISLITGEGGTGKSVLVSIFERLIGSHQVAQLRSDKLNGRFETHGFIGKSVLVGKDVDQDYLLHSGASTIKALTGGDLLHAEQKYGGKVAHRGNYYVTITSNHRLLIEPKGDQTAWRRRLICYEFKRERPAMRIAGFDKVLVAEEGSGILNWLITGFLSHRQELAECGGFRLTSQQMHRVDALLMESDAVRSYLSAEVVIAKRNVTVSELWEGFVAFALDRGWRLPPPQTFQTELAILMREMHGIERSNHVLRNKKTVRGFNGVMLKKVLDQEAIKALSTAPPDAFAA